MKVNRQQRGKAGLSTLGTMLRTRPPARMEEAEADIDEIMATLEPFQRQILISRLTRKYQ